MELEMIRIIFFLGKYIIYMFFWVFFLSISWENQSIYERLQALIVSESFVNSIGENLSQLWYDGSQYLEQILAKFSRNVPNKV
jgi:hypothetical protein